MPEHQPWKTELPGANQASNEWLLHTLEKVRSGELSPPDAVLALSHLPYEELYYAKIDHHRSLRVGFPEVISGAERRWSRLPASRKT
jgi:NCAIR mutase (PurE)-related protein